MSVSNQIFLASLEDESRRFFCFSELMAVSVHQKETAVEWLEGISR